MPLLIIAFGIALLLILVIGLRFNAFIALIIVAAGVGIAEGMPIGQVVGSIKKGVGDTLGELALMLGFGAMLGALIAESGAARVITSRMVDLFGPRRVPWALMLTGFIIGIPLFYTVGFLIVIPLIFAVTLATRLPLLYVGIPMIAALSVTHGFLPPHPAPTAVAVAYQADITLTLLYGLLIAVPAIVIAGWVFGRTFRNALTPLPAGLIQEETALPHQIPGFGIAVITALVPVLLMACAAVAKLTLPDDSQALSVMQFIGDPVVALLIALLLGAYTLGLSLGRKWRDVMDGFANAVKPVAMIMLIIGGGGAFKQVLVDSTAGDYLVELFNSSNMSPLLLAWSIAAALRIALGSATVAALTAAGIAAPLATGGMANPELLVLATGAGSLTCSQVNDTGFWLFKEYFNLSIVQTLKSWTVMETIISVVGLLGVLLLDWVL